MNDTITIIINQQAYTINPVTLAGTEDIPAAEKSQLLTLLQGLQQQQTQQQHRTNKAASSIHTKNVTNIASLHKQKKSNHELSDQSTTSNNSAATQNSDSDSTIDRLRPGDADLLMKRFSVDSNQNENPHALPKNVYIYSAIAVGIIILLLLLF